MAPTEHAFWGGGVAREKWRRGGGASCGESCVFCTFSANMSQKKNKGPPKETATLKMS